MPSTMERVGILLASRYPMWHSIWKRPGIFPHPSGKYMAPDYLDPNEECRMQAVTSSFKTKHTYKLNTLETR